MAAAGRAGRGAEEAVKQACGHEFMQRVQCKQSLGLGPNAPYPAGYDGRCDDIEFGLKKCLGLHFCREFATVLYLSKAPTAARHKANKEMLACLGRHRDVIAVAQGEVRYDDVPHRLLED